MNHFYYEHAAKEKVQGLLKEGQRSQAFHRSGAPKQGLFPSLHKLITRLLKGSAGQAHTSVNEADRRVVRSEYGD